MKPIPEFTSGIAARPNTAFSTPDISIDGAQGLYQIHGVSAEGRDWLRDALEDLGGFCDNTKMLQDVADAASEEGLMVTVNGRPYLEKTEVN